mgnify:CR=1 FL=1
MTLTELKYIVAVAREKHFGRAAEACYVSQPTLSVAVKKLEDEAGIDGISYAGKAEGMSYEAFMARDGIPAEFSSFAVTFTANGETVKTITFAYGGSIDESQIPDCPTVEGNYGTWPEYDYSHLTFDLEVKAEYTAVSTVVAGDLYADNSRTPIVLAEGAFDPATDVHITSAEADGPTLRGNQKLYMKYNVEILNDTVEDDTDNTVSLRVYAPDTGASYTVYTYQNGTWASTSSSRGFSPAWPGVTTTERRCPDGSTATCDLVVQPPREWPKP